MFFMLVSAMLYKIAVMLGTEVTILLHSSHFSAEEKLMIRELKKKIRSVTDHDEKKGLEKQLNTIMEKAFIKKQLRRRNELK
jgi:hypothetical protein